MEAFLVINEPEQTYMSTVFLHADMQNFIKLLLSRKNSVAPNSTVFPDYATYSKETVGFIERINGFSLLENNWDSYGAIPPSPISVSNARRFLLKNEHFTFPFYFVSPGRNGEIMLEFKKDHKVAEIYFNPDGSDELLLYDKEHCVKEGNLTESFSDLIMFFNE